MTVTNGDSAKREDGLPERQAVPVNRSDTESAEPHLQLADFSCAAVHLCHRSHYAPLISL